MTVMDKVEGWNEEKWVGSKCAASTWMYTKAVLCDGRGRDLLDLKPILRIIMDERVTEATVVLKENDILGALNCDIDVPCPLQWRLLWFSAPSSLKRKFVNNGTKAAKFRDTVNGAIELTCNIAFDGTGTPRACFFTGCEFSLELCIRQGLEFGSRDEGVECWGRFGNLLQKM